MITARHHRVIYPLFRWLTRFLIGKRFHTVISEGTFADRGLPVLVIANHISWWDGFWIEYLNQKILHRKFHVMMLSEQLKKHWYFRYTGGFSIQPKSRSVISSLTYTADLLKDPGNLVLMFPQGKIHSVVQPSIHFKKGSDWILRSVQNEFQILFVASFTDYFSNARPTVYLYYRSCDMNQERRIILEYEYQQFYNQALAQQQTLVR